MGTNMNVVAHNLASMNSERQLGIVTERKSKSAEKLASGYRINRAADDAAGLAISEKMRRQVRGLKQGIYNAEDGVSLLQVADGALAEVNDMLHRITEMAVKAANDTNTFEDRQAIQQEIGKIKEEIEKISDTTEFNTIKLFKGTAKGTEGGNSGNGTSGVSGIDGENSGTTTETVDHNALISYIQNSFNVTGTPDGMTTGIKTITANQSSISIDGTSYSWSDFKKGTSSFDISSPVAGTYSLPHKGVNISFSVNEGTTTEDVVNALNNASFKVNSATNTNTPVTFSNLTVSTIGSKTDDLLEHCLPKTQDSQTNDTLLEADENGITLKKYVRISGNMGDYSNVLSTVTWEQMGFTGSNNAGGTYHFRDSSTGLSFDFSVKNGTSKEEVLNAINGAIFDTVYDGPNTLVYGRNVVSTEIAYNSRVQVSQLEFKHHTGNDNTDFYRKLGYDIYNAPSEVLNGIDVEVYLKKNDAGNLVAEYRSNGNTLLSAYNSSLTGSYNSVVCFGGMTGSSNTLKVAIYDSGLSAERRKEKVSNFVEDNGGEVKIADIHIDSYFEYRMTDFKSVTSTTYSVSDVKTEGYTYTDDPSDPSNPSNPGENTNPTDPSNPEGEGNATDEYEQLSLWIQCSSEPTDGMYINIDRMNAKILGVDNINVLSHKNALKTIESAKNANTILSLQRSKLGTQQNRLEHTVKNNGNIMENTQQAESLIRDTDMAKEAMANYALDILQQAGQAVLAQANQTNQGVLSLLQ